MAGIEIRVGLAESAGDGQQVGDLVMASGVPLAQRLRQIGADGGVGHERQPDPLLGDRLGPAGQHLGADGVEDVADGDVRPELDGLGGDAAAHLVERVNQGEPQQQRLGRELALHPPRDRPASAAAVRTVSASSPSRATIRNTAWAISRCRSVSSASPSTGCCTDRSSFPGPGYA